MKNSMASVEVLSSRSLNRALLARQLLLERSPMSVPAAIEHLVGLQAQAPNPPYFALWSRLRGFSPDELGSLLTTRKVVRIALMRSTIHLVTARDCLQLRVDLQPVQDRLLLSGSPYGRKLAGLDMDEFLAEARRLLDNVPMSTTDVAVLLHRKWPSVDVRSLSFAVRNLLPLVQLPPRGVWGKRGLPVVTTAEAWLSKPLSRSSRLEQLILRYLAAFGPASVVDFHSWSGLTRMQEQFEALRGKLKVFRDERGKELFDVPGVPGPDEDAPAPTRFLGEYDNILLSHKDRTRIIPAAHRHWLASRNGQVPGTVLVDGYVAGMWKIVRSRTSAQLEVKSFAKLSRQQRSDVAEEGLSLLSFAASGVSKHDVRIAAP